MQDIDSWLWPNGCLNESTLNHVQYSHVGVNKLNTKWKCISSSEWNRFASYQKAYQIYIYTYTPTHGFYIHALDLCFF